MIRLSGSLKSLVIGVALVTAGCISLIPGTAQAQTKASASISWAEPAYGTKAVEYIVQISTESGPWQTVKTVSEPKATLSLSYNESHRVRIAGVDAEGIVGKYSVPSEAYNPSTDLGLAPQAPQPYLTNP